MLSFTQTHLCDTPFCNISRDTCAIPHQKQAQMSFAILSLQISRDMKSIAAGPLRSEEALGRWMKEGVGSITHRRPTQKGGLESHLAPLVLLLCVSLQVSKIDESRRSLGWLQKSLCVCVCSQVRFPSPPPPVRIAPPYHGPRSLRQDQKVLDTYSGDV